MALPALPRLRGPGLLALPHARLGRGGLSRPATGPCLGGCSPGVGSPRVCASARGNGRGRNSRAPADCDSNYPPAHIALAPVGSAPLTSGFVENIHANGPNVYAHEIYQLNG